MSDADELYMKAMNDALRLLSFRARSRAEMAKRLREKKRYDDATIERVIGALAQRKFLDDENFARLFVELKRNSRGKRLVEAELRRKGVAPESIARAIEESAGDEKEAALALARTRLSRMAGLAEEKKRARLFGLLKRRGFGSDTVNAVFSQVFKETLE